MVKKGLVVIVGVMFILMTFSACTSENLNATPPPASVPATITVTPTIATAIPTPVRPSKPAPVVPVVSTAISVENVNQLTRLTSLGEGSLINMQLSPDGKWIVLGSTNGILVLDSVTQERKLFLPTAMNPEIISFIDDGKKITAKDNAQGYVWTFPEGVEMLHAYFNGLKPIRSVSWINSAPDSKWEYAFSSSSAGYVSESPLEPIAGKYRLSDGAIQYIVDYKVKSYSFSPDEKLVALVTDDKLVLIQYLDGKVVTEIPEKDIWYSFFYPDGKTLVAVYFDKIKFWNMDNYQLVDAIQRDGYITFSPDSSIFAIINGKVIRFIRANDRKLINAVTGTGVSFTSDNQGVFVDNGAGQVNYYVFNVDHSQMDLNKTFSGVGNFKYLGIIGGYLSADNTKLFVIDKNPFNTPDTNKLNILIFDVQTGTVIQKVPFINCGFLNVDSAMWIPSLQTFGVMYHKGNSSTGVGFLDMKTGIIRSVLDQKWEMGLPLGSIKFSGKSDLLVSAQWNRVIAWDIKNSAFWELPVANNELPENDFYTKIGFSPEDQEILIIDTFDHNTIKTQFFNTSDYSIAQPTLSGRLFYLNNSVIGFIDDSNIYIGTKTQQLNHFQAKVIDFDYNEAKNLLATVSENGLNVWDIYSNGLAFSDKVTDLGYYTGHVSISPDGNYVAANNGIINNGDVAIWNANNGEVIYKLGAGYNNEFAFSADSKMIAIATFDSFYSQVIIFDLATGNQLFSTTLTSSAAAPQPAFSPDGNYLAILSAHEFPQIWGIP